MNRSTAMSYLHRHTHDGNWEESQQVHEADESHWTVKQLPEDEWTSLDTDDVLMM